MEIVKYKYSLNCPVVTFPVGARACVRTVFVSLETGSLFTLVGPHAVYCSQSNRHLCRYFPVTDYIFIEVIGCFVDWG
jgi:hypothetical protein